MFKKAASVAFKGETRLRGKERKQLREALEQRAAFEAAAEALLPAKADVVLRKVGGGSSAQFYFIDGECSIVQPEGRDDVSTAELLPTLPALWRVARGCAAGGRSVSALLPVVYIQRPVAKYVFGGANVMAPGVHSVQTLGGSDSARPPQVGDVVAVCCLGNPSACAVGRLKMPAASLAGGAGHGEAVEVLHYFGDALWEACGSPRPRGFVGNEVAATSLEAWVSDTAVLELAGLPGPVPDLSAVARAAAADGTPADVSAGGGGAAAASAFSPPSRVAGGASDDEAPPAAEAGDEAEKADEEGEQVTPEGMSKAMEECLLQAAKTRLKDKDLPITGNALYAQHLRPCRRAGSNIDVKTSSHKKLSTFLQHCEDLGWIALKKNSPEPVVTKIFRDHPDYREWKPWPRGATAEAAEEGGGAAGGGSATATIQVELVWRLGAKLRPLLEEEAKAPHAEAPDGAGAAPADGCWSREECAEVLRRYVDRKSLWQPNNRKRLVPDSLLQAILGACQDSAQPLSIDGLADKVLGSLKPAHRVAAPQGGAVGGIRRIVRDGKPPVVQVRTDTRKGHNVTLVYGLEAYGVDMQALAGILTKALATSVAVEEATPTCQPGIMVQGFWDVAVVEWLAKVGVPNESVQHQARKGQTQKKAKQATNIVKH